MHTRTALLTALALLASAVVAPEANAGPGSGTMVKVHRAKLMAAREKADDDSPLFRGCETGNLEIGVIEAERGARLPRELTVFVDGDVINLNDGRGPLVCR